MEEKKTVVTRAEKKDATKQIIRELLVKKTYKKSELIDEAFALYAEKFGGEDVPNDVKGRVGSVIDVMKKDGEILLEKGVYQLLIKTEVTPPTTIEEAETKAKKETKKKTRKTTTKKQEKVEEKQEIIADGKVEKPKKTRAKKTEKQEETTVEKQADEKAEPLPVPPLQPVAPTAPITPEVAPEPVPEKKKRTKKAKAKTEETTLQDIEEKQEIVAIEQAETAQVEKQASKVEETPVLMDMSFLFREIRPKKEEPKRLESKEQKQLTSVAESRVEKEKQEQKLPVKVEEKKTEVPAQKSVEHKAPVRRIPAKTQTADEKLCEAFLKRIRRLGGEYFEYFSVYLIEKYSRMSGRRLEGLKISGGEHDGGIDGEIELTDRLGFRETIYIQSKNWNPEKGDERLWVVGETLLQQFIGACVCRQARDKKQHARGIFITTSRFTPEAKKLLDEMDDKIVGYDGEDLFETAKECQFGIIKKNGEYVLDEVLLSGEKAFYFM